jgi:anti-anti-sigma regulatory factor
MIVESYEDVIILSGSLSSNFWDTLHTAISLTLKRHPSGVIIDCSQIDSCTPQGAETFRSVMEFVQSADARVIVAAVPPPVMEVLRSVPEVRSQLPIAGTVEDARRSLDLLDTPGRVKRRSSRPGTGTMVVCVTGRPSDSAVCRFASDMAVRSGCQVRIVYPLLVPRDLPLQAPLSEAESEAARALEAAERIFEEGGASSQVAIERARDVASALSAALNGQPAGHVFVGLDGDAEALDATSKLVKSVLAKLSTTVVFVRGSR